MFLNESNQDIIVWPGNTTKKPEGFKKNRYLKVSHEMLVCYWMVVTGDVAGALV